MMAAVRNFLIDSLIAIVTLVIAGLVGEGFLLIKNSDQMNYNIEMWRYARELKRVGDTPILGHEHRASSKAMLQNVEVSINSLGMRGPEPDLSDAARKRIVLMGSSITLGWGVPEEETMRARLARALGEEVQVLNAGIGNYNTVRYVTLLEKNISVWKPNTVVVQYFVNDAEILSQPSTNLLFQHSQLAVTLYHLVANVLLGDVGTGTLEERYRALYAPNSEGRRVMEESLRRLATLSRRHGFDVIFAMTPDIHSLTNYPFGFIHEHMKALVETYGWTYVSLLEPLSRVPAKDLWAIPGDPHPNGLGHAIMAETLLLYLK